MNSAWNGMKTWFAGFLHCMRKITACWILAAALLASSGCSVTPPIVLHEYVSINCVRDTYERMEKAVRDYGCEVDRVKYGFRNGTFIPMTMYGRRRTEEERLRRCLWKIEDEKKEKAQ